MNRIDIALIVVVVAVRGAVAGDPGPKNSCCAAHCSSALMLCCPDEDCRKLTQLPQRLT